MPGIDKLDGVHTCSMYCNCVGQQQERIADRLKDGLENALLSFLRTNPEENLLLKYYEKQVVDMLDELDSLGHVYKTPLRRLLAKTKGK